MGSLSPGPAEGWAAFEASGKGFADLASLSAAARVAASDEHSRSLTLLGALRRLRLLSPPPQELRITLAGADRNEGCSASETAHIFRALLQPLAAAGVRRLRLLLVGPNLPPGCVAATLAAGAPASGFSLRVAFCRALYHESAAAAAAEPATCGGAAAAAAAEDMDTPSQPPHLVVAFNAGVWGYGSWVDSLAHACGALGAPAVVTAYSAEEAEDDADALEGGGLACLRPHGWPGAAGWAPEPNPWASLRLWDGAQQLDRLRDGAPQPSASAPCGAESLEPLYQNHTWSCWS